MWSRDIIKKKDNGITIQSQYGLQNEEAGCVVTTNRSSDGCSWMQSVHALTNHRHGKCMGVRGNARIICAQEDLLLSGHAAKRHTVGSAVSRIKRYFHQYLNAAWVGSTSHGEI